jgi:hypothetical protein
VKGIDESPELACHEFASQASKEGVVHNPAISLAPVEEEKGRSAARNGIKSKR